MKKSMIVGAVSAAALALSASAVAATPGWDVGAQLGWDKYHKTSSDTYTPKDTSGVAGGIFGDYNFNENFGVRAALNKYSTLKMNDTADSDSVTGKYYSLDVLAMGYLPVADSVDLIGGAGVAFVHAKFDATGDNKTDTHNYARPKLLVGANWALDDAWGLELTYSRIFGKGTIDGATSDADYLPTIDLLAVGVTYSF